MESMIKFDDKATVPIHQTCADTWPIPIYYQFNNYHHKYDEVNSGALNLNLVKLPSIDKLVNESNKSAFSFYCSNPSLDHMNASSRKLNKNRSNVANQLGDKLETKRDKNRDAARKCRQKKLEKVAHLAGQVKSLADLNKLHLTELDKIRNEITFLKFQFDQH